MICVSQRRILRQHNGSQLRPLSNNHPEKTECTKRNSEDKILHPAIFLVAGPKALDLEDWVTSYTWTVKCNKAQVFCTLLSKIRWHGYNIQVISKGILERIIIGYTPVYLYCIMYIYICDSWFLVFRYFSSLHHFFLTRPIIGEMTWALSRLFIHMIWAEQPIYFR